jgi:hypothetical protein
MIPARWGRRGARADVAFVLAVVAILAFAFTTASRYGQRHRHPGGDQRCRPGAAVILAAVCNLLGPLLLGAAVADTIASIVEVTAAQTVIVVGEEPASARAGLPGRGVGVAEARRPVGGHGPLGAVPALVPGQQDPHRGGDRVWYATVKEG